jgi:RNA polymerase sigma-70 factor, ECF subfamily
MAGRLFTILRNQFYSECRQRRREVEDIDGGYAKTLVMQPAQIATQNTKSCAWLSAA